MLSSIELIDGEPTDASLVHIGRYMANAIANEVRQAARTGTLGELIGKKGATGDHMKRGDDIADMVIRGLKDRFLDCGIKAVYIYSEEEGIYRLIEAGENGFFTVIDPVDGSNNLRKGVSAPYVSTSIALGRISDLAAVDTFQSIRVGVVSDIFNHRTYFASPEGAYAHDEADNHTTKLMTHCPDKSMITVQTEHDLQKSVVGMDLDRGKADADIHQRLEMLTPIMYAMACQRRLGSTILDLCKVASGEYDSFISTGGRLRLHDIAAAKVIVEQAGGVFEMNRPYAGNLLSYAFRNPSQAPDVLRDTKFKVVGSANPEIHRQVMKYISL